ncbi:MAG: hypothetical protein L6V93_13930 [Clostridiales bacterium]|nr:MAG: hypothetical protein L6V93_13930 [Clostridiales bacterium]
MTFRVPVRAQRRCASSRLWCFLRLAQRLGEYCKGNVNAQNSVAHRVKKIILTI